MHLRGAGIIRRAGGAATRRSSAGVRGGSFEAVELEWTVPVDLGVVGGREGIKGVRRRDSVSVGASILLGGSFTL